MISFSSYESHMIGRQLCEFNVSLDSRGFLVDRAGDPWMEGEAKNKTKKTHYPAREFSTGEYSVPP